MQVRAVPYSRSSSWLGSQRQAVCIHAAADIFYGHGECNIRVSRENYPCTRSTSEVDHGISHCVFSNIPRECRSPGGIDYRQINVAIIEGALAGFCNIVLKCTHNCTHCVCDLGQLGLLCVVAIRRDGHRARIPMIATTIINSIR